jgi:hypothetical protein
MKEKIREERKKKPLAFCRALEVLLWVHDPIFAFLPICVCYKKREGGRRGAAVRKGEKAE